MSSKSTLYPSWPFRRGSCTCSTWSRTRTRRSTWPSRRRRRWTGWRSWQGSGLQTSKLLSSRTGSQDHIPRIQDPGFPGEMIFLLCLVQVQPGLPSVSQRTLGAWLVQARMVANSLEAGKLCHIFGKNLIQIKTVLFSSVASVIRHLIAKWKIITSCGGILNPPNLLSSS